MSRIATTISIVCVVTFDVFTFALKVSICLAIYRSSLRPWRAHMRVFSIDHWHGLSPVREHPVVINVAHVSHLLRFLLGLAKTTHCDLSSEASFSVWVAVRLPLVEHFYLV